MAGVWLKTKAVAVKEFWGLVRQPQLLLMLLVGPVLIMAAFATSFSTQNIKPTAVVVVEPDSEGAELFERFRERFVSHIDFRGTVESAERADRLIERGQVQAAIIIPSNPSEAIVRGERATIGAHYSTINPIYGATVPNRSRGLLFDLNDALVREGIARELGDMRSAQERVAELDQRLERVSGAADALTSNEAKDLTTELDATLSNLESSLELLAAAEPGESRDISSSLEQVRRTRQALGEARETQQGGADEIRRVTGIAALDRELEALQQQLSSVPNVPASVLVNPFRLNLENLAPFQPDVTGFYVPGVLAILIQHTAVSLASLAIVRERLSGAYEFFDVSPLGYAQLLVGKFATYLALVLGVNGGVVGVLVALLNIPLQGNLLWMTASVTLLTVASLGLGFLISSLAKSQLQAIQVAMLLLIASGFFAGFLFPLSEMGQPALTVSYFLPATYGISALQDVMIRGETPSLLDISGLLVISAVSIGAARYLMGRKRL